MMMRIERDAVAAIAEPPAAEPAAAGDAEGRTPPRPRGRRARLALAVAPERLVAVRLRRGLGGPRVDEALECSLAPPGRNGWPELEEALRELAATLGVSGGTVDVALLHRLAHARVVPLPPVGAAELGALVRRSARRHFPVREEPLAAGAVRVPGPREGALAPTLAACAPAALVEAVAAACAGAGFRLGRVVPGAAALAEASRALLSVARRGRVAVVARTPEGGDLLLLEDGAVRRVLPLAPSAPGDALEAWERVAAALRDEEAGDGGRVGCIVVVGAGEGADALRRVAHADEHFGPRLGSAPAVEALPADAFFALGAALAGARVPLLLPEAAVQARAYRARRRTVVLAIASAGFLSFAAGAHLSGLRREVAAVRAARAEIAPAVARAREARANVESVRARLASVAALERGASGWTAEIAAVARALPDSAHLRTLSADSAGLRLGGLARSASEVVPALEASPRFARVALAAPVRWEQGDAGERFDVAVPRAEDEGRRP